MFGRKTVFALAAIVSLNIALPGTVPAAVRDKPGGAATGAKRSRDRIVARWSNGSVTADALKEYAISRAGMAMRHGNEITQDGLRLLLEEYIGQKLLQQAARDKNLLEDPKFRNSYAISSAKEVADRYVKEVLSEKFAVTDEEVSAALPRRKEVVRVKYIVVPTEEEGQEVRRHLLGGMTFDKGIEKYSTVKTSPGVFVDIRDMEGYLDEDVREQILDLSQGEISGVLPMKIGYGVVLAIEKRVMGREEWEQLTRDRKRALFQEKVGRHFDALKKKAGVELNEKELMLAAAEDFDFGKPHRPVLSVSGETIYFDDYVRTRNVHLRDTLKVRTPADLYSAYTVEFANLGTALALAGEAESGKGWSEPEERKKREIRDTLAMRVLGENLFEGTEVTDEEVRKEYENNRKLHTVKKRFLVRRLSFPTRAEAESFGKTVSTPEEFYRQFRQRETREDRYQNTFFEWRNEDKLDGITKAAFNKAGKGKVTEVLSVGDTVHYVYFIEDIQKNYVIPFDEIRVNIKRGLLRQKQQEKLTKFVDGLKKKEKIRIVDKTLADIANELNEKRRRNFPGHGDKRGK